MTLILTALNSDYVVQLSDRRLMRGTRVDDEESNKALLVHLVDGRLVIGYTGLAKAGNFETTDFLTDVILEACRPDFSVANTVNRLSGIAAEKWRDCSALSRIPSKNRPLAVSIFGFGPGAHHPGPVPGGLVISNARWNGSVWEAGDDFPVVKRFSTKAGVDLSSETLIYPIGATGSITETTVAPIKKMLKTHVPAEAIVGKGVELMREWARLRPAAGVIGDQISSIVVPADIRRGWTFDYHTNHATPTRHDPIFVHATGRTNPYAYRTEITQRGGFMAVPKVGRNVPCPCKSGQKYKHCHGERAGGSKGELRS
jgi:hypothetical protein